MLIACVTSLVFCSGKVTYDLTDIGVIAITGDYKIPSRVFSALYQAMKRARLPESKDPRAALFKVIADKYLAAEYKKNQSNGIPPAISAEINKVYYETLAFYIREKDPEKLYSAYVKNMAIPQPHVLKALFDADAPSAYTNVPLKRAEAEKVILATYGFNGEKKLNYATLFDTLPQSGKLHLFTSPHAESLREIMHTHLRSEFLNDFVARSSKEEQQEFAVLKSIVENSILSRNLRYDMGMENANPHMENPALKERAKSISLGRIKDYYEANKDKYKEVMSVDCRHIQLKSYDDAQNLRDKIEHGANMAELVKKYSLAADKNAPEPGLIKGIINDPSLHTKPRLHTLCMSPKQGEVDVMKDSDFYEVVKSEKRVDGYPPLDDTTHLKEDLAREIAALDLKKEFDAKKTSILKRVDIRINKAELEKIR